MVTLHFYPNSWDLRKTITVRENGKDVEKLYEPNVDFVLEEVGKLAGQYGAANIVIEGHTDGSMQRPGQPADGQGAVQQPRRRGEDGDCSRSSRTSTPTSSPPTASAGTRPFDADDPDNHAKNRRVEIKVIALENPGVSGSSRLK